MTEYLSSLYWYAVENVAILGTVLLRFNEHKPMIHDFIGLNVLFDIDFSDDYWLLLSNVQKNRNFKMMSLENKEFKHTANPSFKLG